MTENQIADMVNMYCESLKEGYAKVDKERSIDFQKRWVRDYAQTIVKETIPFLSAFYLWVKSGKKFKGAVVPPEVLIGQKLSIASRSLYLWGKKARIKKAPKKPDYLKRYAELLTQVEFVPEDEFIAKLMNIKPTVLQLERTNMMGYQFIPDTHGFTVKKTKPELNADFVASVVVKVLREMGNEN